MLGGAGGQSAGRPGLPVVRVPLPQRSAGAPPSHTDITSSGSGYGSARANAYKATPAYHQALAAVKAAPVDHLANHPAVIQQAGRTASPINNLAHKLATRSVPMERPNGTFTGTVNNSQFFRAQSEGVQAMVNIALHQLAYGGGNAPGQQRPLALGPHGGFVMPQAQLPDTMPQTPPMGNFMMPRPIGPPLPRTGPPRVTPAQRLPAYRNLTPD